MDTAAKTDLRRGDAIASRATAFPDNGEPDAIFSSFGEAKADDRLANLIKEARRGLGRAMHMRLAQHKVSYGHWTFLRILWEEEGLTQRALSERACLQEPTTFSALKAMEKLGFVERRRLPSSRKNIYVFLTPEGRALKRRLVPLAIEVNQIAVDGTSAADIAATWRTLRLMIDNLAHDEAAAPSGRRVPSTREQARTIADSQNEALRKSGAPLNTKELHARS